MLNESPLKYKAKNCNTIEEIDDALQYYKTIDPDTFFKYKHNILQTVDALKTKRSRILFTGGRKVDLWEFPAYSEDRLTCYHKAIELLPLLLNKEKAQDHPEELAQLMGCLMGALKAAGTTWEPVDFTDMIKFYNCATYKEKVVYLLHSVVTSGFRHPKEIKNQINLYIKLLRQLQLKNTVCFNLPDYHRISYVKLDELQDFSY